MSFEHSEVSSGPAPEGGPRTLDRKAFLKLSGAGLAGVALFDIKMPGINGIEATREVVHTSPHISVLVVTMFEDNDSVFAAMRAGARGYLLKDARGEEVLRAIWTVNDGEAIFGPGVAQRLIDFFSAENKPAAPPRAFPELTAREVEVLILIAQGHRNQEIADTLFLSLKTVRNHVSNIFTKLQVADRAQAVIRAREAGLELGAMWESAIRKAVEGNVLNLRRSEAV